MKNNNFYKSNRIQSLSSTFFLITIFALAAFSAHAQIITSTVEVNVPDGAPQALVTVFDAETGRQIASGATGATNNRFRFMAAAEQEFVIAAITESGYVGSGRGLSGSTVSVSANQSEMSIPGVCYDAESVTLNYTNASGAPLKKAQISIVDRYKFANARRGKTNQQGQYNFNFGGLYGDAFLVAVWKGNGAIQLTRVTPGCSL